MAEDLSYQIIGESAQVLEINLEPNKTIIADGGSLLYIDEEITFGLRDTDGADEILLEEESEEEIIEEEEPEEDLPEEEEYEDEPQREGSLLEKLFVAAKKKIQQARERVKTSSEEEEEDLPPEDEEDLPPEEIPEEEEDDAPSWYITHFTNETEYVRKVAFTTAHSGRLLIIDLGTLSSDGLIIQTGTFLCASKGTHLEKFSDSNESVTFTKEKRFNLDRISGEGLAFLQAVGHAIEKELENDAIRVNLFSIIAFEDTLQVEINDIKYLESMRHEEKTQFVLLTGTGKYWLQAANIQHEVFRISPFVFEPPLDDPPDTGGFAPQDGEGGAPDEHDEADELFEKLGENEPEGEA